MYSLIEELEEALLLFVKERLNPDEYQYLTSRDAIEMRMTDDDLNELKDHFFAMLLDAVNWNRVCYDIETLIKEDF